MADNETQSAFDNAFASQGDSTTGQAFNNAFDKSKLPTLPQPTPQAAQRAPAEAEQQVNAYDPQGVLVSIPASKVDAAVNQGFRLASKEEVHAHFNEEKYGGLGQQVLSGVEGAADAATFGLAGPAEDAVFGTTPEERLARRETNPGSRMIGQATGLIGTALIPGVGAANVFRTAGEGVVGAIGLTGASTLSKVGSAAVKGMVENALFASGDEVSKMLAKDPNQTVETALTNVGLSSLLGGGLSGALGTVSPLWEATKGTKVGQTLKAIVDKANGIDSIMPSHIDNIVAKAGIDMSPEIRATLAKNPELEHAAGILNESQSTSGKAYQAERTKFKQQVTDKMLGAFGKTPDDIGKLADLSESEFGTQIKDTLKKNIQETIDPISEQFEKVKEQFKGVPLNNQAKAEIADQIAQVSAQKGYALSKSAPGTKIVNDVMEETQGLKTLEDLRKYQSIIGEKTSEKQLWALGKDLKNIFRNAEDSITEAHLGAKAPELLETHAAARASYRDAMGTLDSLNDRLRVGRYSGPQSFIKALDDMSPEDILRRLSPKGDAAVIGELSARFPDAAKQLKDYQVDKLLKSVSKNPKPGEPINPTALKKALRDMSPEMREFLAPKEVMESVNGLSSLLDALPDRLNPSGTAGTLSAMWNNTTAGAASLVSMLTGHGPGAAALTYGITNVLNSAPDAARLGLLKLMGSSQPIQSKAFKAMVDVIHAAIKGEKAIDGGIKSVFRAGRAVIPEALPRDREKLDKQLKSLQQDPSPLQDVGGHTGHYMPMEATAMGQLSANAVSYLNGLRPNTDKKSPLDHAPVPSQPEISKYNRALDIAEKPLIILDNIKEGSVTPDDIKTLRTIYPSLYNKLSQKLTENMIDAVNKGETIPTKTKIGLSLFTGQTLDSSMTPQAIQGAQMVFQTPQGQSENQQKGNKPPSGQAMKGIDKMPGQAMTPNQLRESKKITQ